MDRFITSTCWLRSLAGSFVLGATLGMLVALSAAETGAWRCEQLHLRNGRTVQGLIVEETPQFIRFQDVRQKPGQGTVVFYTSYSRGEVERIERLSAKERDVLAERIKGLDPTGQGEKQRMNDLKLQPAPWGKAKSGALSYTSDHFVLTSNAREDIVRRAGVRLEEIYAAYTRFLPPRQKSAKPTAIQLVQSLAEYQQIIKGQGLNILNPAFYDPANNRVVCATDLEQLGEGLENTRKIHDDYRRQAKELRTELPKLYKGKELAEQLERIQQELQRMDRADKYNEGIFKTATRQLFQALYHEAFHAYLANFVYPPSEAEVPRWLNEGLAQIFETAIVEAGELRIGHADADRLQRAQAAAAKRDLVPLAELLQAHPKHFQVAHASDQAAANRYYLTCWALAFYLTFDRQLLGTPRLDNYVRALKRGSAPLPAFTDLVGHSSLAQCEEQFRRYLQHLQKDGTVKQPDKTTHRE